MCGAKEGNNDGMPTAKAHYASSQRRTSFRGPPRCPPIPPQQPCRCAEDCEEYSVVICPLSAFLLLFFVHMLVKLQRPSNSRISLSSQCSPQSLFAAAEISLKRKARMADGSCGSSCASLSVLLRGL